MKFENVRVYNFERALHGMRHPKESYHLSDSGFESIEDYLKHEKEDPVRRYIIGENDMNLAKRLIKAGSEHRKFMRQIFVSVDITAPLYWWKEFDTYKVGTVANSTSTMHKIHSNPITLECFESDDYTNLSVYDAPLTCLTDHVDEFVDVLETLRQKYVEWNEKTKQSNSTEQKKYFNSIAKKYWKELIRWIPSSWLQTRTVTMTYENLFAMCSKGQRRFHKLNCWSGVDDPNLSNFISWARALPYSKEFIFIDEQ